MDYFGEVGSNLVKIGESWSDLDHIGLAKSSFQISYSKLDKYGATGLAWNNWGQLREIWSKSATFEAT